MFYLLALGRPVSNFQSLHLIFDCWTISCFSPLMSPGIFVCFKIKWISFLICHLFFLLWTCRICYKKEKKSRTTYLNQLCTTGIIPYKCVIYTAWRGQIIHSYRTTTYHTPYLHQFGSTHPQFHTPLLRIQNEW